MGKPAIHHDPAQLVARPKKKSSGARRTNVWAALWSPCRRPFFFWMKESPVVAGDSHFTGLLGKMIVISVVVSKLYHAL
jgi:hypothetical protein